MTTQGESDSQAGVINEQGFHVAFGRVKRAVLLRGLLRVCLRRLQSHIQDI